MLRPEGVIGPAAETGGPEGVIGPAADTGVCDWLRGAGAGAEGEERRALVVPVQQEGRFLLKRVASLPRRPPVLTKPASTVHFSPTRKREY
eukprot:634146-Prorocentrum_minimum.AAC.1